MRLHRLAGPELGRIFRGETVSGLSEWQLLERYLDHRDELAFEALVGRHGPMVLGVCRRMLGGDSADADDAFQATFLVLVRRARQLGPRDAIGPWLYGVAARVSLRARSRAGASGVMSRSPSRSRRSRRATRRWMPDLVEVLDQELARLPAKYRSPLVLCYLEGRTHEEAARELGWPVGTVKGRLARGRDLLRSRLTRRGLAPTASASWCLACAPPSTSALERPLVERTVSSSFQIAAGQSLSHVVSVSITSLVEGVLTAMFLSKLRWAALAAIVTGVAFTSAAVIARQEVKSKVEPSNSSTKTGQPSQDVPEGKAASESLSGGGGSFGGRSNVPRRLGKASAGDEQGRGKDPRSLKILEKLEEPISMSFAVETPLDDVLKYIRQATTTQTYPGIPIYVDPVGLQEAERSLNSTVQLDLEGIPLRRTLQLLLTQLGLAYFVEDGILVITSDETENQQLPPSMMELPPILVRADKAMRGDLAKAEMVELIELLKARETVMKYSSGLREETNEAHVKRDAELKEDREQMKLLLKEMRELINQLKTERQAKKGSESK